MRLHHDEGDDQKKPENGEVRLALSLAELSLTTGEAVPDLAEEKGRGEGDCGASSILGPGPSPLKPPMPPPSASLWPLSTAHFRRGEFEI